MRTFALLTLMLGLACVVRAADDPDPEPPGASSKELRALQGKWIISRLKYKSTDLKPPREMSYTFKGNKLTTDMGTRTIEMTVKITSNKHPFTMEMTQVGTKTKRMAIFKIEKGDLFLALNPIRGNLQATDFSGKDAPVLVLTKKKQ